MSLILRYVGAIFMLYSAMMIIMYIYDRFVVLTGEGFPFISVSIFIIGFFMSVFHDIFSKGIERDDDGHAKPKKM